MPEFIVTDESTGEKFKVTGPSEEGARNVVRAMRARSAQPAGHSVGEDVAKTIPSATARMAAGVLGAPAGLMDLADKAWQYGTIGAAAGLGKLGVPGMPTKEEAWRMLQSKPLAGTGEDTNFRGVFPKPELLTRAVEKAAGAPLHQPQTWQGQAVDTAIQMAPNAVMPGSALQRGAQVAIPTATAEGAAQGVKAMGGGETAQGVARAVGGIGGAVGAATVGGPSTPQAIIRELAPNLTDNHIYMARQLMDQAAAQGVRTTWPEALARATNGEVDLRQLQRFLENSPQSKAVMSAFMTPRGAAMETAGNQAIGGVADQPMSPYYTGTEVRRAAGREIEAEQSDINAITRPLYEAAEQQRVGRDVSGQLAQNPLYRQALEEIRSNPALNARIENLPNDNAAVVELVQRRMGELAENLAVPGQASTSNLASSNWEAARTAPRQAAEMATGGEEGYLAQARAIQERLRREHLEPLQAGPVGTMSRTDDVMSQGEALLPRKDPVAGMDAEVAQTVRRITRQNPEAAQNLVRTYLQTVFNSAIKRNVGTADDVNPQGGAKFSALIYGDPQQRRNMEAAIRALPNGNQRWLGMQNFLETAETVGMRLAEGSGTSFNELYKDMARRGSFIGEGAALAGGAGVRAPARLKQWYDEMRMGRNTNQLAEIITNPASERLLRQLANTRPGTPRAQALALRLTYLAGSAEGEE